MKTFKRISIVLLFIMFMVVFISPITIFAATTPNLLTASNYGVLSGTFTANGAITVITGDAGYTTLGGSGSHTVTGSNIIPKAPQAGTDQGLALAALDIQACTFSFAPGAIDLATDTTHGQIRVYAPGVYCVTGAVSVGTAGIVLNGTGTYIFRSTGALDTVANSIILSAGASSCDVFWTPGAEATLGANSTFIGTIIDDAGITIGNTVALFGRALAFATTVITDTDTIDTACTIGADPVPEIPTNPLGMINVVKLVINDSGGIKTIADFPLFVNDVSVVSGATNTFSARGILYTITETNDSNYTKTFSGDCDVNGQVNLNRGDNKFCIITNNDIGPALPLVSPLIDILKTANPLSLPLGPGSVTYTYTARNIGTIPMTNITLVGDTCSPIVLISGDTNLNNILDLNEVWIHRCTTTLLATHTNTVVATGWANGISATDIASATVIVGAPVVPPLIHVVKRPNLFVVPIGGAVIYTYTVTNPGSVPLSNVTITDDKCTGLPSRILGHLGDLNKNDLLENNESWSFTCKTNLFATTTNTATAIGYDPSGLIARDFAFATVVVTSPKFPKTGFQLEQKITPWVYFMNFLGKIWNLKSH